MNLAAGILKLFHWKVSVSVPHLPKAIVCVAPHTSNWDFILGELAWTSVGRRAGFLMKASWFFFPLNLLFKAIGGIPVQRTGKHQSLTEAVIDLFRSRGSLTIAITPEGTRSKTANWHTGFLRIAVGADVPIFLGVIDGANKHVLVDEVFIPSGDIDADMRRIKDFYAPYEGIKPGRFSTDDPQ